MILMTQTLQKRFAKIGLQDHVEDPIIVAKFSCFTGFATWYLTDYVPRYRILFGYLAICGGWKNGLRVFSLDDLQTYRDKGGYGIKRDRNFQEQPASQVINKLRKGGV